MTAPAIARLDLKVGDIVEVRSEAEILATLDADGALDALPFMPEMLQYVRQAAGRRQDRAQGLRHPRAHRHPQDGERRAPGRRALRRRRARRLRGRLHDLLEARLAQEGRHAARPAGRDRAEHNEPKLPQLLQISARRPDGEDGSPRWKCQATEMRRATPEPMPVLKLSQYVEDVRSGNVGPAWAARTLRSASTTGSRTSRPSR